MKTITCNFYLRGQKEVKTIYFRGFYRGQEIYASTGMKVKASHWDKERSLVSSKDPHFKHKRKKLSAFSEYLEDPFDGLVACFLEREGAYPNTNDVKEEIQLFLIGKEVKEKPIQEQKTFWDYYDQFVQGRATGKERKPDGSMYSKNIIKNYNSAKGHFLAFKKNTTFRGLTLEYYKGLQSYLFGKGLKVNSVARVFVTLKTFAGWAYDNKLHSNTEFQRFQVRNEEVDTIYCNEQKLFDLKKFAFSGTKEIVRDWFIIGCYTALRVSDLLTLTQDNIKEGRIHVQTKKTNQKVIINCHFLITEILGRWDGFPPKLSDQEFNRTIKKVCEEVGFDEMVEVNNSAGGQKKLEKKPFWSMVSSHTCRRSGATNMYLRGVPVLDIMKVTGHKTEKAFYRYIRVTLEETADRLAGHSFYKEPGDVLMVAS